MHKQSCFRIMIVYCYLAATTMTYWIRITRSLCMSIDLARVHGEHSKSPLPIMQPKMAPCLRTDTNTQQLSRLMGRYTYMVVKYRALPLDSLWTFGNMILSSVASPRSQSILSPEVQSKSQPLHFRGYTKSIIVT